MNEAYGEHWSVMDITRPIPANRPKVRVPQLPRLVIIKSNYASCIYIFCLHFDRRVFLYVGMVYVLLTVYLHYRRSEGFFRRGQNCSRGTDKLKDTHKYLPRTNHLTS